MKKTLGLICMIVALGGLGWKLVTAAFTIDTPSSEATFEEIHHDAEGRVMEQRQIKRKMLTFTRLKVNEGAELLVTAEGLELKNSGTMTLDAPIVSQVNDLTWWAMVITNLAAGFYLLRKEKPGAR